IPVKFLKPKVEIGSAAGLAKCLLDKEIVLYCKSGIRSAQALTTLKAAGLHNVKHLDGGIAEWTRTIDSSLLVY
uniref:rhodanese-like domain-containing protein n=1 Tax=Mycobacterium tuberculosis TaxID=1773 RepID=UPI00054CC302